MFLALCIILLALSVFDKPVDKILGRIKGISWKDAVTDSWNNIVRFSKKAGREATRTALLFYYTLKNSDLTTLEKACLYAGIAYVIVPGDFLPMKALGIFGIMDDAAVIAWIHKKIKKNITQEVRDQAEDTLCKWFGPETMVSIA